MSEVILALLVLISFVIFLLLFCIIMLTLALVIYTRKGKTERILQRETEGVEQKGSRIVSKILGIRKDTLLSFKRAQTPTAVVVI